ncbi:hypothetical protein DBR45_45270 [Pseudomonas sp. HMWF031]|nr:hypothetical protein DBR45_45270 [Pseudomonas sp. HMWF031]
MADEEQTGSAISRQLDQFSIGVDTLPFIAFDERQRSALSYERFSSELESQNHNENYVPTQISVLVDQPHAGRFYPATQT